MKPLTKPFMQYVSDVKTGLYVLLAVSVVRFLMLPVFGVPYKQGTHFVSATIFLLVIWVIYLARAARASGTTYGDILGMTAALFLGTQLFVVLGILVDDLGGISTYYTDPDHGGNLNTWFHAGGHVIFAVVTSLIFWGIGSLVLMLAKKSAKPATA